MNLLEEVAVEKAPRWQLPFRAPSKRVIISLCVVVGVLAITFGAAGAVRLSYKDRILPGVHYANLDLGGLDRVAAAELLQKTIDAMLDKGLTVLVDGNAADIALRTDGAEFSHNFIDIDIASAVDAALAVGKSQDPIGLLHGLLLVTIGQRSLTPDIALHDEHITNAIRAAFAEEEDQGETTKFAIEEKGGLFTVSVEEGKSGLVLDITGALSDLRQDAEDLSLVVLNVDVDAAPPAVSGAAAEALEPAVQEALANAPYTLAYTPENATDSLTWDISATKLTDWLTPGKNGAGDVVLTLDQTAMADFFADIHDQVDIKAQDARFAMEGDRVIEFAGSHNGITVNEGETIRALTGYFSVNEGEAMQLVVDMVEPNVTTANVNNLGITEALGTGYSSYKGSPSNRIKNIAHGVSKLNGLLIAPDQTVSLIDTLGPFTVADGYLPELVIKGDEIKPEIGGGLCQIGTTTFRAVMNSGLKVDERRNHSLVVTYYNDPGNGNPGTDATIYDPAPDFKFTNDTGNYILLAAEMNTDTKELFFTFWGTDDGREASYTPPTVLSWSGYGDTQYTETDSLAPGVESCQSPHPGATTTFTYTVNYADGTTHEEEFFSTYRSLPKICLVGKSDTPAAADPAAEPTSEPVAEEPVSTDEPVPAE